MFFQQKFMMEKMFNLLSRTTQKNNLEKLSWKKVLPVFMNKKKQNNYDGNFFYPFPRIKKTT